MQQPAMTNTHQPQQHTQQQFQFKEPEQQLQSVVQNFQLQQKQQPQPQPPQSQQQVINHQTSQIQQQTAPTHPQLQQAQQQNSQQVVPGAPTANQHTQQPIQYTIIVHQPPATTNTTTNVGGDVNMIQQTQNSQNGCTNNQPASVSQISQQHLLQQSQQLLLHPQTQQQFKEPQHQHQIQAQQPIQQPLQQQQAHQQIFVHQQSNNQQTQSQSQSQSQPQPQPHQTHQSMSQSQVIVQHPQAQQPQQPQQPLTQNQSIIQQNQPQNNLTSFGTNSANGVTTGLTNQPPANAPVNVDWQQGGDVAMSVGKDSYGQVSSIWFKNQQSPPNPNSNGNHVQQLELTTTRQSPNMNMEAPNQAMNNYHQQRLPTNESNIYPSYTMQTERNGKQILTTQMSDNHAHPLLTETNLPLASLIQRAYNSLKSMSNKSVGGNANGGHLFSATKNNMNVNVVNNQQPPPAHHHQNQNQTSTTANISNVNNQAVNHLHSHNYQQNVGVGVIGGQQQARLSQSQMRRLQQFQRGPLSSEGNEHMLMHDAEEGLSSNGSLFNFNKQRQQLQSITNMHQLSKTDATGIPLQTNNSQGLSHRSSLMLSYGSELSSRSSTNQPFIPLQISQQQTTTSLLQNNQNSGMQQNGQNQNGQQNGQLNHGQGYHNLAQIQHANRLSEEAQSSKQLPASIQTQWQHILNSPGQFQQHPPPQQIYSLQKSSQNQPLSDRPTSNLLASSSSSNQVQTLQQPAQAQASAAQATLQSQNSNNQQLAQQQNTHLTAQESNILKYIAIQQQQIELNQAATTHQQQHSQKLQQTTQRSSHSGQSQGSGVANQNQNQIIQATAKTNSSPLTNNSEGPGQGGKGNNYHQLVQQFFLQAKQEGLSEEQANQILRQHLNVNNTTKNELVESHPVQSVPVPNIPTPTNYQNQQAISSPLTNSQPRSLLNATNQPQNNITSQTNVSSTVVIPAVGTTLNSQSSLQQQLNLQQSAVNNSTLGQQMIFIGSRMAQPAQNATKPLTNSAKQAPIQQVASITQTSSMQKSKEGQDREMLYNEVDDDNMLSNENSANCDRDDEKDLVFGLDQGGGNDIADCGVEENHNSAAAVSASEKNNEEQEYIKICGQSYIIYMNHLLDQTEANSIFSKLVKELLKKQVCQNEYTKGNLSVMTSEFSQNTELLSNLKNISQWKAQETQFLQYIVLNEAQQKQLAVESFEESNWDTVEKLVPGRSKIQCQKRWLFIQKKEGTKAGWTTEETAILALIAEQISAEKSSEEGQEFIQGQLPKEWTRIARTFNQNVPKDRQRRPRQCRERWINVIDPSVRRDKWSLDEEIAILRLWLENGSQWHKIAQLVKGRTEIQVKNKFKCIIKKSSLQVEKGADGGPALPSRENVQKLVEKLQNGEHNQFSSTNINM